MAKQVSYVPTSQISKEPTRGIVFDPIGGHVPLLLLHLLDSLFAHFPNNIFFVIESLDYCQNVELSWFRARLPFQDFGHRRHEFFDFP